jgi:hypothetical protein
MSDETELERVFREGLRRAADRTEVGVPLIARSRAGARTRRRRRWGVASAVVAVVAVAGVTAVVQGGDVADPTADQTVTQPSFAPVTEWRPESWHGLTVDVPADWGWGTAPISLGDDRGQAYFCGGPGADLGVGGARPAESDTAWVGRPIMLSDACGNDLDWAPAASYVWLGADVPEGGVSYPDGFNQTTIAAFGTTLTVGSPDKRLADHILGSARATTDCEAQLPSRPEVVGMPIEGLDPVHSAQLCAYQQGDDGFDLVYAATLDEATAKGLYAGDGLGAKAAQDFCASKFKEYVLVRFSGKDAMGDAELTADWVVDPGCQQAEIGPGFVLPLKDSALAALSRNGLPVVLRSFIGMLG